MAKRKNQRRLSRNEHRIGLDDRRSWDPKRLRKHLLEAEYGTIRKDAPTRVGLCYPNPYHTGMSSLGFQVIYRMINAHPSASAERIFLPDDVSTYRKKRWQPISVEEGRTLDQFDLLAFSVAYDLDIPGFFELLSLSGVPILREERGRHDPPVIVGGPITASNVLPLGPFVDAVVVGDGEIATPLLVQAFQDSHSREDFVQRASTIQGVWVPEIHENAVPATQKVRDPYLPAIGQIITPHTELSNMFLVEASRGCPRFCKFCLVRAPESPMRESELHRVIEAIPSEAPRVGFVGAAVSEWSGIKEALAHVIGLGKGVGISSLRADRLDAEFVRLLAAGGAKTMTVAADAASQRLRNKLAKGIRTEHLRRAAAWGKEAGMRKMKLYVIVGLPDETKDDLDELVELVRELQSTLPIAVGASPLVPKLHTPLGDAPFKGVKTLEKDLGYLKRQLGPLADMRATSARWAWVEYRVSQGGQDTGLAAYEAWKEGGRYANWVKALEGTDERAALAEAEKANLWLAAGMK
jgi:radical SAM superfamily enzyme YgiQ (UPF0313 family)